MAHLRWVQDATLPIKFSSAQMAWNSDSKTMYHFGGTAVKIHSMTVYFLYFTIVSCEMICHIICVERPDALKLYSVYIVQFLENDRWENTWKYTGQHQLSHDSG